MKAHQIWLNSPRGPQNRMQWVQRPTNKQLQSFGPTSSQKRMAHFPTASGPTKNHTRPTCCQPLFRSYQGHSHQKKNSLCHSCLLENNKYFVSTFDFYKKKMEHEQTKIEPSPVLSMEIPNDWNSIPHSWEFEPISTLILTQPPVFRDHHPPFVFTEITHISRVSTLSPKPEHTQSSTIPPSLPPPSWTPGPSRCRPHRRRPPSTRLHKWPLRNLTEKPTTTSTTMKNEKTTKTTTRTAATISTGICPKYHPHRPHYPCDRGQRRPNPRESPERPMITPWPLLPRAF